MTKRRRWWAWASGLIAAFVVLALGRPGLHLARTMLWDRHDRSPAAPGSIADASGLDETRIMEAMTRELIDAALGLGGRYYLPYRLHATSEQLRRAYPQISRFFELKRRYDPHETFQNSFYLKYAATHDAAPVSVAP